MKTFFQYILEASIPPGQVQPTHYTPSGGGVFHSIPYPTQHPPIYDPKQDWDGGGPAPGPHLIPHPNGQPGVYINPDTGEVYVWGDWTNAWWIYPGWWGWYM